MHVAALRPLVMLRTERASKVEAAPAAAGSKPKDDDFSQTVSLQTSVWALLDLLASSWLSFDGKSSTSAAQLASDGGLGPVYAILFSQLHDVARLIIQARTVTHGVLPVPLFLCRSVRAVCVCVRACCVFGSHNSSVRRGRR